MNGSEACGQCGRPLDVHDRHFRFIQPDPVLDAGGVSSADVWMSHADANTSVMMQVNNIGAFVRALLPVHLTGGHAVTYGVWVGLDPKDLRHVFDTWWSEGYSSLVVEGFLANAIEPWGLRAAPIRLEVLNTSHTPYCVDSPDKRLRSLLRDDWDHDLILSVRL